jgi:hypothetical protein
LYRSYLAGYFLKGVAAMRSAEEILENVVLLIGLLDDDALEEVQDLPFLEMAKDVSVTRAPPNEPELS